MLLQIDRLEREPNEEWEQSFNFIGPGVAHRISLPSTVPSKRINLIAGCDYCGRIFRNLRALEIHRV